MGSARAIYESNIVQVNAKGFGKCIRRDPAIDSMAAMYARMFVKVVNDPDRILDEEQEICNDQTTALADSLSEYSPDTENLNPKNFMSRIVALAKRRDRTITS